MSVANPPAPSRGQTVNQNHYLVIDFRLASGEAVPLIVERPTRLADTYSLRYALITYRSPGLSPNSMRNALQGIAIGLSLLEERNIDMMSRLAAGLFLSRDELAVLANRCLRRVDGRGAVVRRYAESRYVAFLNYIEWRFEAVLHRALKDDLKVLKLSLFAFQKRTLMQKPKGRAGAQERDRLGLTHEQRALLLEVIQVDSPRNPFKLKVRRRNRALIMLHYRVGLRAGELAGLQRVDYRNLETPPQLFIHIRDNFPGDTRVRTPRAKTRARMLQLPLDAAEALDTWLADRADRAKFPLARKSHYIFVNEKGRELSLRAASDIFERLVEVFPELSGLCAHALRHDMNDRLVEQAERDGTSDYELAEDQIYLNGWSDESTMPTNYTKRSRATRANKKIMSIQQRTVS